MVFVSKGLIGLSEIQCIWPSSASWLGEALFFQSAILAWMAAGFAVGFHLVCCVLRGKGIEAKVWGSYEHYCSQVFSVVAARGLNDRSTGAGKRHSAKLSLRATAFVRGRARRRGRISPTEVQMKILYLTAGAAGMYCGSCLLDNALATELIARGHDVILQPLYTPTLTDEKNVSQPRIFFGGISVYLEQHIPLFRKTPWFFDRLWDSAKVIRSLLWARYFAESGGSWRTHGIHAQRRERASAQRVGQTAALVEIRELAGGRAFSEFSADRIWPSPFNRCCTGRSVSPCKEKTISWSALVTAIVAKRSS